MVQNEFNDLARKLLLTEREIRGSRGDYVEIVRTANNPIRELFEPLQEAQEKSIAYVADLLAKTHYARTRTGRHFEHPLGLTQEATYGRIPQVTDLKADLEGAVIVNSNGQRRAIYDSRTVMDAQRGGHGLPVNFVIGVNHLLERDNNLLPMLATGRDIYQEQSPNFVAQAKEYLALPVEQQVALAQEHMNKELLGTMNNWYRDPEAVSRVHVVPLGAFTTDTDIRRVYLPR